MSDDNREIEQVEAEIVQEGRRVFTMPDEPKAPEPEFVHEESAGSSAGGAGASDSSKADDGVEHKFYYTDRRPIFALISLGIGVIGIITCCFNGLPITAGIAAIVLGLISNNKEPEAKNIASIGIFCGIAAIVLGVVTLTLRLVGAAIGGVFTTLVNILSWPFSRL